MKAIGIGWLVWLLAAAAPLPATAQWEDDEEESASDDEASSEGDEGEGEREQDGDDGEAREAEGDGEAAAAAGAPRSWYFGPYLRYTILPAFMLKLGLAEAPTVDNASFGVAANHRDPEGTSFEVGLGYTGLGFNGPMRADGDPPEDTEWVDSELGLVHVTASVYWTVGIMDKLSFEYGLGLDFGLMIGDLTRTEAYRPNGEWARCPGVIAFPLPGSTYCEPPRILPTDAYDAEGAHYGVTEKRVPPVGGNLMIPRLALRYEPIPEVAVKVEGALGFPMFFIGLSAAYGPEL